MESRLLACRRDRPESPATLHESVRRLLRVRSLMAVGLSVAACVALGSSSAFADTSQTNDSSATTGVAGSAVGSSVNVLGPVVAPISPALGANLSSPINANVLGNQSVAGGTSGATSQSNTNQATTAVATSGGGSAPAVNVGGAIVAPIAPGIGVNAASPLDLNVLGNQGVAGTSGGAVSQSNANSATTVVAGQSGAASAVGVAGPVV